MTGKNKIEGIACSIFQREIEQLIEQRRVNLHFEYIDSELHMKPLELKKVLTNKLKPYCVMCYGKCEPNLDKNGHYKNVIKTEGLNCIEILLGKQLYRKLRAEGAFFLLPEWTHKWERIFKELLGLSDIDLAREFMHDMHTKMIYVNTNAMPIPSHTLNDIENYFDMPVEVLNIALDELERNINLSIKNLSDED